MSGHPTIALRPNYARQMRPLILVWCVTSRDRGRPACAAAISAASPAGTRTQSTHLEALAVHDGGPRLVVLLLGDPHLLEGGERREDGAADPHAVLALGRRDDLHLHRGGRERS